jgi:hypothetical protein
LPKYGQTLFPLSDGRIYIGQTDRQFNVCLLEKNGSPYLAIFRTLTEDPPPNNHSKALMTPCQTSCVGEVTNVFPAPDNSKQKTFSHPYSATF